LFRGYKLNPIFIFPLYFAAMMLLTPVYIGVIIVCARVCSCDRVFASSDALDDEKADALSELGRVVFLQTKLSATQGLLSHGTVGTELAHIDQRMLMMTLLLILVGLWILCAIVWQLRTATETLPETKGESSATPGTSESAIDNSTTLQTQQSPTSTSSRDTTIDEIKFHLMTLVIYHHFVKSTHQQHRICAGTVTDIVAIVHMPAFVILSGMFSKSLISQMHPGLRDNKLKNTCVNLLGAFLVSGTVKNVAISLGHYHEMKFGMIFKQMFVSPPGPWYLLALFWWRIVWCPISTLLDPRARVPAAIFFAVGFANNKQIAEGVLACRDTFYFLPYFQIGLHLSKDDLTRFSGSWTASASLFIFFFVLPFLQLQNRAAHWIHLVQSRGSDSEEGGGLFVDVAVYGFRACLSMLAIGLLLRIAQISITTKIGKTIHSMLAGFGRQSLYVYVLHMSLFALGAENFAPTLYDLPETVVIPLQLLVAVVLNILFSTEFTKNMCWWMCEPSYLFSALPPTAAEKTTITAA